MEGGTVVRRPVLVLFAAAALALLPFAAAQPWPRCNRSSGNYSSGSTYEANLFNLITDLRGNASSSPSFFASGSAGTGGASAVYGLILCRGDVSASDCFDCGTWSGRDVQSFCDRARDVALVYNQCYVRVSDTDFLASPNNTGQARLISGTNISSGVDVAAYDRAVTALLNATARHAVGNSTGRLFATARHAVGNSKGKNNSVGKLLGIILPVVFLVVVASIILCVWNMRKKRRYQRTELPQQVDDFESIKSTLLSLSSLQAATNNFNESNKLGEGGFGAVYKGNLSGQEVAVKRLSKGSDQGLEELRNELVLVAKLHHKNLVRLEGFCLEEGEKLLVYEYMPNKSLDTILFEPDEKRRLDWRKRFNIIEGVARGLQYLHEDSQQKIVHRDMKASNVLLGADMNPKIGDFGLARLFGQDQTRDVTNRIVGTFGYMSPEYVMRGQYSAKLDVFSFGVLVIEIITGRRNSGQFFCEQNEDIISIVWRHWSEGSIIEIIDDSLGRNYSETEVLKCINIGLLCLQQNPIDRPTMSDIVVMLNGDDTSSLPPAARLTFFLDGSSGYSSSSVSYSLAR